MIGAFVAAAAPGDSIECGTDASSWWNDWSIPGCTDPQSVAGAVLEGVITAKWIKDFKNGVADTTKTLVSFWISVPDPKLSTGAAGSGAPADAIAFLWQKTAWLAAVVMCFLILFQAGRIIWDHKGSGAKLIVSMLVAYFLVVSLAIPSIVLGLAVTTALAKQILDQSTVGTSFADNLFSLFNNSAGITSTIALCALLFIGIVLAGLLCILMIARGGILYVMVGSLLLAAAGYASETGKEAFERLRGWIIAMILYKLAAAAVLGVGFRFLGTDLGAPDNGMLQIFYGLSLLVMSILALPACIRLVAPAASPLASGSGAGASVAGAAAIAGGTIVRRAA